MYNENMSEFSGPSMEELGIKRDKDELDEGQVLEIGGSKLSKIEQIIEVVFTGNELESGIEPFDVPEILYRGERVYLNNIDQIGQRDLSTIGHEQLYNQNGKVYLARDKEYATSYAVGKDGVTWYDEPLPKEKIPIGVIYEINNTDNAIAAIPEGEPLPDFPQLGELAGKHREFTADKVPVDRYRVIELQIMNDFIQPNGHRRSDMREILEVFSVNNSEQLPQIIEKVKNRIDELDMQRQS